MADRETVMLPKLSVSEQTAELLQVDAKSRQELILAAANSLDLVRALSSETLLYTIKEIGIEDGVDLLVLAAPEQVRDIVDLDCWRKDSLDDERLINWLMLLDEGGSRKIAEWFLHADIELLVLLVKRYFEVVRQADIEEDPDFDQAKYFTFDDQYLLRFRGEPEPILHLLIERVRELDYRMYLYVLENSLFELESGLEEAAFRWRTARLEDRGYPRYEEVQDLFRFVPPESFNLQLYERAAGQMHFVSGDEVVTPPDHALALLPQTGSFFSRVLTALPPASLEQIGQELAYLTNSIVTAEARDTGDTREIRRCVEMAHDHVNIGLAFAAKENEIEAQHLLRLTQVRPFFQVGRGLVQRLQHQANQMAAQLHENGLPEWESYLDTPFREMAVGVRRRMPVFFVGLETPGEIVSRHFGLLSEVKQVQSLLAQIPIWLGVLQRWELLPAGKASGGVTLAMLWNTAFAHWVLESQVDVRALQRQELETLHDQLPHASLKERWKAFLVFAAEQNRLTHKEQAALETLARHARDKIGEVLVLDAKTVDLRFVEGLLVAD